ncbi:hypothetical protein LTR53_011786 [Teratosphaeriaceae sp. CCFEE 6253]|nr:hypothetical protein LTR53_011786 [Teratosphaeriaceae sp. CCFEE 6253]
MPALPNLATCKKLGFIVPSSNTAVEPLTTALLASLPSTANIIPLFTRIRVKTVGTDPASTAQFSTETMVAAAQLLADAEVDAILWNGTSGMWTGAGLDAERELARAMEDATGVPCSTTTLATVAALEQLKVKGLGIATPYARDLALRVEAFFEGTGHGWCVEGRNRDAHSPSAPATNLEIAKQSAEVIRASILEAAGEGVQAVIVGCTNWPAAGLIEGVEAEMRPGVTIVDSVVVTVWRGLRMVGYTQLVEGWGRMMREI